MNFQVYMDPVDTAPVRTVHLALLYDKKPQIGTPGYATIYQGGLPHSLIDKDAVGDRFVIIKDWKIALNAQSNRLVWKKYYTNLTRMHTSYAGTALDNFETGRIFLIAISDSPTIGVVISGTSRFCFADN